MKPKSLPFFVVKAFTSDSLMGNPAGIVIVDEPLSCDMMQRVAFINSFPETVFLKAVDDQAKYQIFWFTPTREVHDAGHATLAAQYVVFNILNSRRTLDSAEFYWDCGYRKVERAQSSELRYELPSIQFRQVETTQFPGCEATYEVDSDLVLILKDTAGLLAYEPNMDALANSKYRGLTVTSPDFQYDYGCRFFAPKYGVNEDNVTATVHKYLACYWSELLRKTALKGIQYSKSEGIVSSRIQDGHCVLSGDCCLYSQGTLNL